MTEITYVGMESKWHDAFHIKRNAYVSMDTLNVVYWATIMKTSINKTNLKTYIYISWYHRGTDNSGL
jgi:hypothetical protein